MADQEEEEAEGIAQREFPTPLGLTRADPSDHYHSDIELFIALITLDYPYAGQYQFRFLPDHWQLLANCCDWDWVSNNEKNTRIVHPLDIPRIVDEWQKDLAQDWAQDLKQVNTDVGKVEYCFRLYALLSEIKTMCEPNLFDGYLQCLQSQGIQLRRSPEVVWDMMVMHQEQIHGICTAVMKKTKAYPYYFFYGLNINKQFN